MAKLDKKTASLNLQAKIKEMIMNGERGIVMSRI